MDIKPDETHRTPPLGRYRRRRGGRHDSYGSVLAAHPDSRRGGHLQTTGSQPIMFDGLPNLRLPEAPGTRNAPTLPDRPDGAETPRAQSHAPTTARGRIARSNSDRPNSTSDARDRPRARSTAATGSAASSTSTTEPPR